MTLWMEVEPNELGLPVRVCDTVAELAEKTGVRVNSIYSVISHGKSGRLKHPKFVKVEVEDTEEKCNEEKT